MSLWGINAVSISHVRPRGPLLIGSRLRSPWRIERSSRQTVESIRGSVELSGSSGRRGYRGVTLESTIGGSNGFARHRRTGEHCGWITCDPIGRDQSWCHVGLQGGAGGLVEESSGDSWIITILYPFMHISRLACTQSTGYVLAVCGPFSHSGYPSQECTSSSLSCVVRVPFVHLVPCLQHALSFRFRKNQV